MKMKSYICKLLAGAACVAALGSCEDMLEPDSVYNIYENGDGHFHTNE